MPEQMKRKSDGFSSDSESDDMDIDVTFDFFDFKEIDFHGLKSLLTQTFSHDSEMFNLSELSDLIIKQSKIGCAVKVEDTTDPYAVLSVINMNHHKVWLTFISFT